MSKQLSEIMSAYCDMKAVPEVPCEDIESYGVDIKQHDHGNFPSYPETGEEAIQRQ